MRVLFMAKHRPGRAPSQRFRFEQVLPYLRQSGIECDVSYLLSQDEDRTFYGRGDVLGKARVALRSLDQRRVETSLAYLARYDVVYLQREALFFGPPLLERRIERARPKLVFDFDDAVWVHGISAANRAFAWLKFSRKTADIIRFADVVVAGNPFLAAYAREQGATDIRIIPTTIDTDQYVPGEHDSRPDRPVCIGWSGSFSTVVHFETALGALRRIKKRFGDHVCFKLIGDASYARPELDLQGQPWRRETEIDDLREIDIGLMPLPDIEWAKGKCALKGLQYMALEIPTIMSPVGVNTEVIDDGIDGFLASTEDEWVDRISRLVEDSELRRRMGAAGRKTVLERYSLVSQRVRYRQLLEGLASAAP